MLFLFVAAIAGVADRQLNHQIIAANARARNALVTDIEKDYSNKCVGESQKTLGDSLTQALSSSGSELKTTAKELQSLNKCPSRCEVSHEFLSLLGQ